jgi:hypothetical protein
LDSRQALKSLEVCSKLSMLILVGKEKGGKVAEDAKRLYAMLKKYHPDPPPNQAVQMKDLFYGEMPTKLQGAKMLGVKTLNVERFITQFIELRLVKQTAPEFNWRERKK